MKKIMSVILIFFLLGIAYSEEPSSDEGGVFVPFYDSFMERLCEMVDEKFAVIINRELYSDGVWDDFPYGNIDFVGSYMFYMNTKKSHNFLDTFSLSISEDIYAVNVEDYLSIIKCAMYALREDYDDVEADAMIDSLLVNTITSTPIDYMSQHENDGVYRYGFTKSYGMYTFSMDFSIYEYN